MNNENSNKSTWREVMTVKSAISILFISFAVVVTMFAYTVFINDNTLLDKILNMFNAFIMAVLGYLFGYVPTKSSEESTKKDKEVGDYQLVEMEESVANYKKAIAIMDKKLKTYENIISLYETP